MMIMMAVMSHLILLCRETFFNANCVPSVFTPACGWEKQVALVCSIPWPSRQIAPHSYLRSLCDEIE